MARMLPAHMDPDVRSAAERQIFKAIREGLPESWCVLHSLGMARHERKPWAEIDFVLCGPTGIFCLEVKGGRIARKDGTWMFTDRRGSTALKNEGPWTQVMSAQSALRNWLVETDPQLSDVAVGYGVIFPDVRFDQIGPDIDKEVLFDRRDFRAGFDTYIDQLSKVWRDRITKLRNGSKARGLSSSDVDKVVGLLRRDFDLRPSLLAQIRGIEGDLLRLTRQQYRVLDGLIENPRMLVRGSAGTGKTLLAFEEARRLATSGERVLLCCFNNRLAHFLSQLPRNGLSIDVCTIHSFMGRLIDRAGLSQKLSELKADISGGHATNRLYQEIIPDLALEAMLESDESVLYDALVVDEGQDVLAERFVDVFDTAISGGIANGTWRVFMDPRQDLFGSMVPAGLERLARGVPAHYRLTVNCRNTQPIALATAALTGQMVEEVVQTEGPKVTYEWARDRADLCRRMQRRIMRLLSDGMGVGDIVVLSSRRFENSEIAAGVETSSFRVMEELEGGDALLAKVPHPDSRSIHGGQRIEFSTIARFKGLERGIVLLCVGREDLRQENLSNIYVGASRARAVLDVFALEDTKDRCVELAGQFGQRLALDDEGSFDQDMDESE